MEKLNSFISNLSRAFTSCSIRGENVERQGRRVAQGLQNQVRNNNAQQAIEMAQRANEMQGRALLNPIMGAAQQAQQPVANDNAQPAQQPAAEEPAQQPVAEEPVAEEPVAEEPVAEEPVAIHQPVAAEQQALTEQQLNEQIQNLNKLLASPDREHRNEEIFQLLKKVNNSAPNRLVIGFDKHSPWHHLDDDIFIIGGEIEGDYDPKSDECKCDYNDPYHHKYEFKLSDVQHVHIVSPLENKLYCTPHNFSIFGYDNSWRKYENAKLKMNGLGVNYCLDYGYRIPEAPSSLPMVHEFPDGSKFIEGIEVNGIAVGGIIVKDGENITQCPGVIYEELIAHPEPFKINHCNGYTENDYRRIGTLCLKYYTGNSATDPDRGYYCLNNNDELVKCGDLPNDFEFKHDILNEVFCLGKYAKQAQQPAEAPVIEAQQPEQPVENNDVQQAQQPAAAQAEDSDLDSDSDSDSDLPAEAPAQPVAAQQQPEQAQAAEQPQQPVAAEQPEQAQPAQQPAAEEPVADEPAQQPVAEERVAQPAEEPAADDNAQQAQQPVENANAQQAQQPAANDNAQQAQQAQQPDGNDNAQQAQQPVENANAQQQAQQPVENANAQQPAQQPAANDNAQQAQQPAANDNAQQAQQPDGNNNAQQARAAQQNNPNPIFTARHTIGTTGYNLENAPAMNKTGFEGTHSFAGYGPNYNQRIEMNSDENIEDKFVFRNIPEVKISKGNQLYTFAHERIVRVKRSGSIDQNDGQLHIDRDNNVRTNGQIH